MIAVHVKKDRCFSITEEYRSFFFLFLFSRFFDMKYRSQYDFFPV